MSVLRPSPHAFESEEDAIRKLLRGVQIISAVCAFFWFFVVAGSVSDIAGSRTSFLLGVAALAHGLLPSLCFFLRYVPRPWAHRTLLSACWLFAGAVIVFIPTVVVGALITEDGGHGALLGAVYFGAALVIAVDGLRLYGLIQLIIKLRRPEGRALFGLPPRPRQF